MPNTFDDLLSGNLFELSGDESDQNVSKDDAELFVQADAPDPVNTPSPSNVDTGSNVNTAQDRSPPQPWRKGLWCLNQGRGAPAELLVDRRRRRSQGSHRENSSLGPMHTMNTINQAYLESPPLTPSRRCPQGSNVNFRGTLLPEGQNSPTRFEREKTLSPSPMYAQLQYNEGAFRGSWQQDFQDFHLQLPVNELPLSPPLSGTTATRDGPQNQPTGSAVVGDAIPICPPPFTQQRQRPHVTIYPGNNSQIAIDPGILGESTITTGVTGGNQASNMMYSAGPGGTVQTPFPVWMNEETGSSSSSQYSYEAPPHAVLNSTQIPPWWPSFGCHGVMHQNLSFPNNATYMAAPIPQRLPHQILHAPPDTWAEGLGIHCHPHDAAVPPAVTSTSSDPRASYVDLPGPCHDYFTDMDPFSTPGRGFKYRSPSRSPSPSISPTHPIRGSHRRSPTRSATEHHRRKSIHKPGPIKDKERDREFSKTPRTPKTPKTPTSANRGFVCLDFVNFTPKDSVKLLNDVAPSGSSKTRARREAEAREKRKRLSEAAVRAVRNAGGDVSALEKAIRA